MNILVTGAKGFVGKNLVATLESIRDGKDNFHIIDGLEDKSQLNIMCYDLDSTREELEEYCQKADFVFNLAGVNRPKDEKEFMEGNFGFASELLELLEKNDNKSPVMLSSSIQASLEGRYANSPYGESKLAGEKLFEEYSKRTGAKVLIYRFPNLFGKWCRPNYNSAVATFCNNKANDLPIQVNDRNTELELVYIDDLVDEMILAINGKEHRDESGCKCACPVSHKVTLGEIVDMLDSFVEAPVSLLMPEQPEGSFIKKLYSTYLSYLPVEKAKVDYPMATDARGSFTELMRMKNSGQISVNITKPGQIKGQHWHHSKWEIFIVLSGQGVVQQRKIGLDENGKPYPAIDFELNGEKVQGVYILPGYTHNIINTSETEDLIILIWANEIFDSQKPETYRENV